MIPIGIFDHLDSRGVPLQQFYAERLQLVARYDQLGFFAYHVAEHHSTPLGLAPSPSVYLSAVAQRTRRIRFGPLVYILPLYHPLRLAEEIAMLDHMGGGRLQVGIGRGISPIEVGFFGVDPAGSQAIYLEAFEVLRRALTQESVTHHGAHFHYENVPTVLRPLQQPHPPLWYGIGNAEGVDWCVANHVNGVVNGPADRVRQITDRFHERCAVSGLRDSARPLLGTSRHVVVAETDAQALARAERAYARWHASFMHLWRRHGQSPQFGGFPEDPKVAIEAGLVVAGTAASVRENLQAQVERLGVTYLLARFAFGDLSLQESLESTERFAAGVLPSFAS
jgi:alkanesulfonate monooxygenase SsuD/methylene tetrahydromethanopterin reductase-like flavin-dependent oxidoreductase (luciferase family)